MKKNVALGIIVALLSMVLLNLVFSRYDFAEIVSADAPEEREEVVVEVTPKIKDEEVTYIPIPIEQSAETKVPEVETLESEEVPSYTDEELEIMAIIIYQEAGGDACSDDTRRHVGTVFMNRVESEDFPDTIYEVATQKGQYGRLYWTGIQWPDRATNPGEAHAVERAWNIAREILEGVRTLPSYVVFQSEYKNGTDTYLYQDGLYFCY